MRPHIRRLNQGFSLVEVLVATTLGLLVIAGMITGFAGNKRSNDINTAVADLQESARFAVSKISMGVRSAGFQGCVDVNNGSTHISAKDAPTTKLRDTATTGSVVGATSWSPAPPTGFVLPVANPAIEGTHTLALQFGSDVRSLQSVMNVSGVNSPAGKVVATGSFNTTVQQNDLMIVSDCSESNLFQVSDVTVTPAAGGVGETTTLGHSAAFNVDSEDGIASGNLTKVYGLNSELLAQTMVMRFSSDIYYVGDTGLSNDNGDDITALYKQSFPYTSANPPTEIVRGVENMRIAFGIRQANQTLTYVAANHVRYDSASVESIQIGLLMVSWDRITRDDDENTYILAGQEVAAADISTTAATHPKDNRLRLAFNTTVKVRNRRDEQL